MPKKYEAIKRKLMSKGVSKKAAETKAAKIYNGTRKTGQKPVTRGSDKAKTVRKKKRVRRRA